VQRFPCARDRPANSSADPTPTLFQEALDLNRASRFRPGRSLPHRVGDAVAIRGPPPEPHSTGIAHVERGSHSSSTAAFLDMIRHEVAIIFQWSHGGHRHPRQSTRDVLLSRGNDVYQTNEYQPANPGGGNVDSSLILDFDPRGFAGAIVTRSSRTTRT
jgi:hypothetical protein